MCSIHQVEMAKLTHINRQVYFGQHTAHPSLRGKHTSRPNKIAEDIKEKVPQHILSYPAEPSHYSRTQTPHRLYVSAFLTINKMYDEYKKHWDSVKEKPVLFQMYRHFFNNDFNLGFGTPRSDTSVVCDRPGSGIELHKSKAEAAFEMQRLDRASTSNDSIFQSYTAEASHYSRFKSYHYIARFRFTSRGEKTN